MIIILDTINTLKLTVVVELHCESAFVFLLANAHSLQLPLAVQLSRKAHKDSNHTAVIATMHQHLCAKTHPDVKVFSIAIRVICLHFDLLLLALARLLLAVWLSCDEH